VWPIPFIVAPRRPWRCANARIERRQIDRGQSQARGLPLSAHSFVPVRIRAACNDDMATATERSTARFDQRNKLEENRDAAG
jgi:hypothetical protein